MKILFLGKCIFYIFFKIIDLFCWRDIILNEEDIDSFSLIFFVSVFIYGFDLGLDFLVLLVLEEEFLDEFNKFILGFLDLKFGLLGDLILLVVFCE